MLLLLWVDVSLWTDSFPLLSYQAKRGWSILAFPWAAAASLLLLRVWICPVGLETNGVANPHLSTIVCNSWTPCLENSWKSCKSSSWHHLLTCCSVQLEYYKLVTWWMWVPSVISGPQFIFHADLCFAILENPAKYNNNEILEGRGIPVFLWTSTADLLLFPIWRSQLNHMMDVGANSHLWTIM